MTFLDNDHRRFYEQMLKAENAEDDVCRRALFYTLGLTEETRVHIRDLYSFTHHCLLVDGLRKPWQVPITENVTRLAFNLFSGYMGHDGMPQEDFGPYYLFDCELLPVMLEAVRVRFPACAKIE